MLALDEVDRLLDMGFKDDLDKIMENLPASVQTLLYSATISKKVKDMTRVKLKKDYEYISIHDFDSLESKLNELNPSENPEDKAITDKIKSITPVKLLHYYMEVKI